MKPNFFATKAFNVFIWQRFYSQIRRSRDALLARLDEHDISQKTCDSMRIAVRVTTLLLCLSAITKYTTDKQYNLIFIEMSNAAYSPQIIGWLDGQIDKLIFGLLEAA